MINIINIININRRPTNMQRISVMTEINFFERGGGREIDRCFDRNSKMACFQRFTFPPCFCPKLDFFFSQIQKLIQNCCICALFLSGSYFKVPIFYFDGFLSTFLDLKFQEFKRTFTLFQEFKVPILRIQGRLHVISRI